MRPGAGHILLDMGTELQRDVSGRSRGVHRAARLLRRWNLILFPTQACFKAHLASPTPAQEKVKTDFCAQCPDGTSPSYPTSCSEFFAVGVDDAGQSTTVGNAVLAVSDALAATMDMQCTGAGAVDSGISDCASSFKNCVGAIVHYDANLPAPCTDVMAP